jgi:serine/threonine protein phosphatase PrpC/tRNA A-37 threonylcarbamoyl transferase component Bud32
MNAARQEEQRRESADKRAALQVEFGICSQCGRRDENQDFSEVRSPKGLELATRGVVAAVADGLGGQGGRVASEVAVRHFIDFYYQMPETMGVPRAASRALRSINSWISAQARSGSEQSGMATTFSGLVLRGRRAHVVHVGDTRIYRLRNNQLRLLTDDHTMSHPDMKHVLHRAVGLDENLRVDLRDHSLQLHDRFLICSDGVHQTLGDTRIQAMLAERSAPEVAATEFVEKSIDAGSQDNATAVVMDVVNLPLPDSESLMESISQRAIFELPSAEMIVDDFELESVLCDGRYSRLFIARDRVTDDRVVLKFPHPRVERDAVMRNAAIREAWIAARVRSPFVGDVIELPHDRYSRLYTCMPYYEGTSLEERLRATGRVSLEEGIEIGTHLCRGVYALHQRQVIHRDIKPENVILERDGGLKLLDLGVALLPGFPELASGDIPGTPSYMAPELFAGDLGSERTDVYALGVTLYAMFSGGQYPYGEVEPFSHPRFGSYRPLTRSRPNLPAWLDQVLATATEVDPEKRYGDTMELAFDLENGLARGGQVEDRFVPFAERNPVRFWKIVSVLLALALVVSLLR